MEPTKPEGGPVDGPAYAAVMEAHRAKLAADTAHEEALAAYAEEVCLFLGLELDGKCHHKYGRAGYRYYVQSVYAFIYEGEPLVSVCIVRANKDGSWSKRPAERSIAAFLAPGWPEEA